MQLQECMKTEELGGIRLTRFSPHTAIKISLSLLKLAYTRLILFTVDHLLWQNL